MAGVIVAAWELLPVLNSYLGLVALPSDEARDPPLTLPQALSPDPEPKPRP